MTAAASDTVIACRGLAKTFDDGRLNLTVFSGIDLDIRRGERMAIVGSSGAGKSTLLHILGGLDSPTAGTVSVAGREMSALGDAERSRVRNASLGFVYQFHHLLPEFTAQENVAMPLLIRRTPRAEALATAAKLLDRVGLGQRLDHKPGELSGGERQRAAVARALVTQPACVLADEPTGNLDTQMARGVMQLLEELHAEGATILMVTHDPELAARAQRNVHVIDGQVVDIQAEPRMRGLGVVMPQAASA